MVPIVQLVRASDCGSECRRFESDWAPSLILEDFLRGFFLLWSCCWSGAVVWLFIWASELGLLSDFPFWKPSCHSWLDFPTCSVWKPSFHSRRALLSGLTVATRKGQSAVDGLPEVSRAFRRALSPPKAGTKRRTPLYKALCGRVVRFVLFGLRGKISVLFELRCKIRGYGSVII